MSAGLFMAGCALTVGARFDSTSVVRIKSGLTTKAEVREILGKPESEGLKDGRPLWTYLYARVPMLGGTAHGTVVTVEFNKDGVVESYTYIPY